MSDRVAYLIVVVLWLGMGICWVRLGLLMAAGGYHLFFGKH